MADPQPRPAAAAQPSTGAIRTAAPGQPAPAAGAAGPSDKQLVAAAQEAFENIRGELAKVIVGQDKVIEELLIAIFARGHCMLEGVPGLAKTLLISTLARTLHLSFKRIQFTPDLMPSDIVGTEVLQEDPVTKARVFKFLKGPIFSNIVLADEINRTPPKTQAALLEAMQEKKVSVGNDEFKLDPPFFVLATQNPIDQEGTYPLPEAQLDRFLFKIFVGYPSDDEETEIMRRVASPAMASAEKGVRQVLSGEQIIAFQQLVLRVPVADHVLQYAKALVRATRPGTEEAPDFIKEWISWGAGPRASINLILAAKARAVLYGQFHVTIEDIDAVAVPVLRHRIACSYTATAEDITTEIVVQKLIESIPKHEKQPAAAAKK
jgi:MoxR-like ATPase